MAARLEVGARLWPFSRGRSGSEWFGLTGGVRFWSRGLGDKEATGGNTDGVAEPRLPFDVVGLGGESFVGEMPVLAGGSADA